MGFLSNLFGGRDYKQDVVKNMVDMANFITQKASQGNNFSQIYEAIYLPVLGKLVANNTDKKKYLDYFRYMVHGPSIMDLIEMYGTLQVPQFQPEEGGGGFLSERFDIENYMITHGVPHEFFSSCGSYLMGNGKVASDMAKSINNSPSYKPFFRQLGINC